MQVLISKIYYGLGSICCWLAFSCGLSCFYKPYNYFMGKSSKSWE